MTDLDFSKWIGDGSEATLEVSGDTITIASKTTGTPFNARLDANIPTAGDLYYEASIVDLPNQSSLGVGLVAKDKFLPGWKTKGYFYNRNISNGSAGLIIGFGPNIKTGDVVGVYLRQLDGDAFEVIYYHNGRCLGAGFSIKDSSVLYPCLHVSGSASVKVSSGTTPTVFAREDTPGNSADPYSGNWEIKRLFVGPELGEFPLPQGARFKVTLEKQQEKQYRISVHICNTFSTSFELGDKMESFDSITFKGGCASTRKMPRPELDELERLVGKELGGGSNKSSGLKKMMVTPDGNLLISGPIMEITCVHYVETFQPVTSID